MPPPPAPPLAGALDWLLACAERGVRPDAALHELRAMLSGCGLLLGPAPDPAAGEGRHACPSALHPPS